MRTPQGYFSDTKPILLRLLDPRGLRVLDAGCGAGGNGALVKRAGAAEVVGVELDPAAAERARAQLDRVLTADLSELDPDDLGPEPFDAILAIDVLEHLVDPAAVLRGLVGRLKPGGVVVASIPNVAHVWVIANLLAQRWPQRERGIFDRTHLRFFARRDMERLLREAGLTVERVEPYFTRYRALKALSLALSLYVFRSYFARQYLLVGRKPI
jgi:2-polyprenyl-3-methyl-5-hydroxy-6-metoxy-1,4-benzoquinol methylase